MDLFFHCCHGFLARIILRFKLFEPAEAVASVAPDLSKIATLLLSSFARGDLAFQGTNGR
jgi:hypothetical protein